MDRMLHAAIAYRHDFTAREHWSNARLDAIPISCPSGCAVEYELLVPLNASGEDVLKWIEATLDQIERQHPQHLAVIQF
jgi:hypothetical protein